MQLRFLASPLTKQQGYSSLDKSVLAQHTIRDVADEIVRLLNSRVRLRHKDGTNSPLRTGQIAVLTRTRKQAEAMQEALRLRQVHSVLARSGNLFECDELAEVRRLLVGLLRIQDLPRLRSAWATELWGIAPEALHALERDPVRLQAEIDLANRLKTIWNRQGIAVMFHKLLEERQVRARLAAKPGGERQLTNYLQTAELLTHAAAERRLLPEALHRWLEQQCQDHEVLNPDLRELRMESDADAVQIMTIHVSKGLEFEIVFVPFLGNGFRGQNHLYVHRPGGGRALVKQEDAEPHERDAAARDRIAEDTRLAYVALTRARQIGRAHV
mgnify:FL=1